MKTLEYQKRAIEELVQKTMELLGKDRSHQKIVFDAPTGSGKTVMATCALEEVAQRMRGQEGDPAIIWIAPNRLHEQSYFKMKVFFGETRKLRPVKYDELDHGEGMLRMGEVLFVNWESINKEKNVMVRDTEQGCSLIEMCRRTREAGHPIVVVIDEEHECWSGTADKSRGVLEQIAPRVELRISASPKTRDGQLVKIDRRDVIEEEMIKEGIVLNADVRQGIRDERTLAQHLIEVAMRRRQELAEAYRREGARVNPLLLIQLPNDTNAKLTQDDQRIVETVKLYLEHMRWDCTVENGRLAVWLSNQKENLEGIEAMESTVEVLLFKQAIAKGWDCPRAGVLLIFRRLNSYEFTMQTVGRIMRMPEQRFYGDGLLNKGYVYTDVSRERIAIVADGIGYISRLVSKRRDDVRPIALEGRVRMRTSESRNRLGSDFKGTLRQVMVEQWRLAQTRLYLDGEANLFPTGEESVYAENRRRAERNRHVAFDVRQVAVEIPEDVELNLEGITEIGGRRFGYARSGGEITRLYADFCSRNLGPFEKSSSTSTLGNALLELMEELFECFEYEAMKVILSSKNDNQAKFAEVIRIAIGRYERRLDERKQKAAERAIVATEWQLPEERLYDEETNEEDGTVKEHALLPFVRQRKASDAEKRFEDFLERHKESIAWWYKNGDNGREHYAVDYVGLDGTRKLFYVDFIILLRSGRIMLMDTKSGTREADAPAKHNALIDYMKAHEGLAGGVVVEDKASGNWLYCEGHIENLYDHRGWKAFFPEEG